MLMAARLMQATAPSSRSDYRSYARGSDPA